MADGNAEYKDGHALPADKTLSHSGRRRSLKEHLTAQYNDLKVQLMRRLGSRDLAEEALHEIYLRLNRTEGRTGPIKNPTAYLLRAALNTASNQERARALRLSATDIDTLLHIADDAPGAMRIIEGRDEFERLKTVLAEMPVRRSAILLAARLEHLTHQEIAKRYGVSVSSVEKELMKAQEHCADHLGRKKPRSGGQGQ